MTDHTPAARAAIQESERNAAVEEYFGHRAWIKPSASNFRLFEAGFDRAYALLSKLRAPVAKDMRPDIDLSELAIECGAVISTDDLSWTLTYGAMRNFCTRARAALASAPVAPSEVMDALNWVDDFIARCNRDDRGACESVNVLRRALASAPASEDGLTAKQAWWAGYRAGKGLPPDTPRQDAVKVDISSARLVTHWPNGTPRDERDTASDPEGKLIHDPTEPLLAASAPVADAAPEYFYSDDGKTVTMTNAARAPGYWTSAPVAGEALNDLQALQWAEKHGLQWVIGPPDTIREVIADAQRLAAPQASEAMRQFVPPGKPLPDLMMASYHEAIGWNACRAAMLQSAALSAQPGAQKKGGSDA